LNLRYSTSELPLSGQYILKPEPVFLNLSDVNETRSCFRINGGTSASHDDPVSGSDYTGR
jgi:hypothetical protein